MNKPDDEGTPIMTAEQSEALLIAFASLADAIARTAETFAATAKPIIDAYNQLPPELKERIAKENAEGGPKP